MLRKVPLSIIVLFSLSSILLAFSASDIESIQITQPDVNSFVTDVYEMSLNNRAAASDPSLHRGWPVSLSSPGAGFPYTPTLLDIDGDGADEIFLVGGNAFGLSGDGTFLPGWPTVEHLYMGYGTNDQMPGPSCADRSFVCGLMTEKQIRKSIQPEIYILLWNPEMGRISCNESFYEKNR